MNGVTQIQITDSCFTYADSVAKQQVLPHSTRWYGGEGGNIIMSLLIFSVTGIWPIWRNLTGYYLLAFLIPFVTTLTQKPGQFSTWKVCVRGQMQFEFPCILVQSCLQICTNAADLADKEHHHQTSSVNFIWKDKDILQTPRDTFSSTS